MTKTCNSCGTTKDFSEFGADKRNKDGKQGICASCRLAAKRLQALKRRSGMIPIIQRQNKKCNKCLKEKLISDFFADSGCADGRSTICKSCKIAGTLQWQKNNREHYNAKMRAYNAKHYQRLRLLRYKLSLQDYERMHNEQDGKCAICRKLPNGKKPLCVDHDHKTGKARGLLCTSCNQKIVILDNHEIYDQAVAYLKKHAIKE